MAAVYGVDWSQSAPSGPGKPLARSSGRLPARFPNPGLVLLGLLVVYALTSALGVLVGSQLVWNRTASMPLGLYAMRGMTVPQKWDLVALRVPPAVRQLVHDRRYLPDGSLLIKPVAAVPGDSVCRRGDELLINGRPFGVVLTSDAEGRPLPSYDGCVVLGKDQIFLASHHPRSFDSRTFGPVDVRSLQGTVTPLWTF